MLGMKEGASYDMLKPGFVVQFNHSAYFLSERSRIPVNWLGTKVVSGLMDEFNNNIIAPDHFLKGISKCVTEASVIEIGGRELRKRIDIALRCEVQETGSDRHSTFLTITKRIFLV